VRQEGTQDGEVALTLWSPERALRSVDPAVVRYSKGFLRCRPEKWFPGCAMQWLPLAHSLGIELKLVEAKTMIDAPRGLEVNFAGTIDSEPIGLAMELDGAEILLEAIVPGAKSAARKTVLEYMARRFLASLAISWSGPESTVVQFEPDLGADKIGEAGAVKLVAALNGNQVVFWILLGKGVVDKLDGLWRRQLQSTSKQNSGPMDAHLELAHLTVPPSMLSDYLKSGTTVDLEIPVGDAVVLVSNGQPWMPARLCRVDGAFAVETVAGPMPSFGLPSGTTRLSIELGRLHWDGSVAREMAQAGAIYDTGLKLQDRVQMVVNGEKVGDARLHSYQGRFVVSVL
jgi:flagellar motor switch/type III secretory pathway protein FliN